MGLTLPEVLVRALKKLDESRLQRFIKILRVREVRSYPQIREDELRGKYPEHIAHWIYACYDDKGAEVTLNILADMKEWKVREELQQDLMEVDTRRRGLGTPMSTEYRVTFIDRHRSDLIRGITDVDPVLRDLRDQELLTQEQYDDVMGKPTYREKMEELWDVISHWENTGKYKAYTTLRKLNEPLIKDLERKDTGGHFIDRHREDLIHRITAVDPVVDDLYYKGLLTAEEWANIRRPEELEEKMRRLYEIIRDWDDRDKDEVYNSLYRHNPHIIADLKKEEESPLEGAGDHFIDRHREDLICRITDVYPVMDNLFRKGLLTMEQWGYISRRGKPEEMMRRLYDIIRDWDDRDKDEVYNSFYKCNPHIIDDLKKKEEESQLEEATSQESETCMMGNTGVKEDDLSCKLCDQSQSSGEVITPTVTDCTYRLSMTSPGLFRCSESGIQFQVTQPVTIEYEVDSWSNYTEILQNLRSGYEIIGPLFNIKSTLEPNVVSAVFLPHCLCLGGYKEDKSLIKCFHYKDDNLVLESTSRMEAMFAVLENPTFSCIGVILYPLTLLKDGIISLLPYHGMVLLFCNTIPRDDLTYKYRLHLYLLPNIRTVEKEVERYETRFKFQRIHKPLQTESVYSKKKYRITGPQMARVFPKTLLFESHCSLERYPFIEININGEKNTEVNVSVLPEDKDITVWEAVVSAEEMLDLPSAMSRLTIQPGDCRHVPEENVHFLDKHRADLIGMISVIDPVLDDLLALKLLTYEQYQIVLIPETNPEKMRKLYDYVRAWGNGDKDKVYQALKKHNYPIIKQLKNEHNDSQKSSQTFKCIIY